MTGKITVTDLSPDAYGKSLALKNSAPFSSCITRVNEKLIEDAKDLDIVMPMYNLLHFSKNYGKTTGSFWNYRFCNFGITEMNQILDMIVIKTEPELITKL